MTQIQNYRYAPPLILDVVMSLFAKIQRTTIHAKSVGALHSLTTAQEIVVDQGIPFTVRLLERIQKKEQHQAKQEKKQVNPFLPYEADLFVANLSASHVCILNKFNVVDHHILIITRDFQSQEKWITLADFEALAQCMQAIDGLAFFNGGPLAGASQPHKHLQLIPFSGKIDAFAVPLETAIATLDLTVNQPVTLPIFPFRHALIQIPENADGQTLFQQYECLLKHLKLIKNSLTAGQQTHPYNLLITRRWMLLVHRTQDRYEGISVNSLGFAGALLVRDRQQLEFLKKFTPLQLLKQVSKA
ncbi:MAG: Ap4A phosphorylase II [Limnothrix sp.]